MFDFSGFGSINIETVIAAVTLIGTSIVWLLDRYLWRRKRLVYRVQVDAQIGVHPRQNRAREMVDIEVVHQGKVVQDPSIVLLRLDNAGTDIEARDMQGLVKFSFPGRKIVRMKVVESHPDTLGGLIEAGMKPAEYVDTDTLTAHRSVPGLHPVHAGAARAGAGRAGAVWRATPGVLRLMCCHVRDRAPQ